MWGAPSLPIQLGPLAGPTLVLAAAVGKIRGWLGCGDSLTLGREQEAGHRS